MEPTPQQTHPSEYTPNPMPTAQPEPAMENKAKSYILSVILSYFVGGFGIDRFYLGYTGLGIVKLLTLGGLGVWSYIDVWLVTFGVVRQKGDPRPLDGYADNGKAAKIILGIWLGLQLLMVPVLLLVVFLAVPALQRDSRVVEEKNEIAMVQSQLTQYASGNRGTYPSKTEFGNSFGQYISTSAHQLNASDVEYLPTPEGCDNHTVACTGYHLDVKLSDGTTYNATN